MRNRRNGSELKENLIMASHHSEVPFRFNYAEKDLLGCGGMGAVFREPYEILVSSLPHPPLGFPSYSPVVQKVSCLTRQPIFKEGLEGIYPVEFVTYDSSRFGQVIIRDSRLGISSYLLSEVESCQLQRGVAEYVNLRALRGIPYFQQIFSDILRVDGSFPVVTDREFFLLDGYLCVKMTLLETPGEDLGAKLVKGSVIPLEDIIKLTFDLGQALQITGEKGIVHRDIKPDNIMIEEVKDQSGNAVPGKSKFRLIDFGNSTRIIGSQYESDLEKDVRNLLRTRTDYVTGTPGYIAPEQVNLSAAGCKEDWWALGSTLYHLLTGKVIFEDQGNKATNFTNFMMVHSGEMNYEDLEKLRQDLYSISPLNSDYLDAVSNLLSPDIADRNLRKASQISDDLLQGRIPLYRSQMDDSSRVPLRMRAVGLPTRVSNRVKFSSQSVWT